MSATDRILLNEALRALNMARRFKYDGKDSYDLCARIEARDTARDAIDARVNEQVGCNARGRAEHGLDLLAAGETKAAAREFATLARLVGGA